MIPPQKSYLIFENLAFSSMVFVEGGKFLFDGNTECEVSSFFIGQYLVTQEIWGIIMASNPSLLKGLNFAVNSITWYDSLEFCNRLSQIKGLDEFYRIEKENQDQKNKNEKDNLKWLVSSNFKSKGYRLLTEKEFEYVARGGQFSKGTEYPGSNNMNEIGWFDDRPIKCVEELGMKIPNELGIYDLSGNLWEWCWDWYEESPNHPFRMSPRANNGKFKVLRGGSWVFPAEPSRVYNRHKDNPDTKIFDRGLRLAKSI